MVWARQCLSPGGSRVLGEGAHGRICKLFPELARYCSPFAYWCCGVVESCPLTRLVMLVKQ